MKRKPFWFSTHDPFDVDYFLKRRVRYMVSDKGCADEAYYFDVQEPLREWRQAKAQYVRAMAEEGGTSEAGIYVMLHRKPRRPTEAESKLEVPFVD